MPWVYKTLEVTKSSSLHAVDLSLDMNLAPRLQHTHVGRKGLDLEGAGQLWEGRQPPVPSLDLSGYRFRLQALQVVKINRKLHNSRWRCWEPRDGQSGTNFPNFTVISPKQIAIVNLVIQVCGDNVNNPSTLEAKTRRT